MYLDFIKDIAKVGDRIKIICTGGSYVGTIVRFTDEMIAIRDDDGTIIIKADADIDGGIELQETSDRSDSNALQTELEPASVSEVDTPTEKPKTTSSACLDLFDSIYQSVGIDLDARTISNGSISSNYELVGKKEIPVLLDSGEIVGVMKWRMAGYSQTNCTEGKRIFVVSDPYASALEMTYEELRDHFYKSVGIGRTAILYSIQKTLFNTPDFYICQSDLKRLKTLISQLDKEYGSGKNAKSITSITEKEEERLEVFVKKAISEEDANSPLSDAAIRTQYAQIYGISYKTKIIRGIRERLGIPDKQKRSKTSEIDSPESSNSELTPTCEITKYFSAHHNGAATSKEYPEIRFLDEVVEPSLLAELQSFHKGSSPIPAVASVSRIGHFYYATFLVKPASIEQLKEYSDAFKLASKTDVANALDAYIVSLDSDGGVAPEKQESLPDLLAYARRQRLIHNYDTSENAYLRLIENNYSLDAVVKELASMYQEIGKIDKAQEVMEQYFDRMDDKLKAYNFISTIYAASNDIDKALDALNKCFDLCDNDLQKSKLYYNIALLYIKKSDNPSAVKALHESISLNPNNKASEKLLRLREKAGKQRLIKKVDKILSFKTEDLIEYDIVNNGVNDRLVLSEETTSFLLLLKQLRNSGNDNSDEYKDTVIKYAVNKGIDLIKSDNPLSGRDYLLAASKQERNDSKIENECLYLASFYPQQFVQLLNNKHSIIKDFLTQVEPIEDESLFYGMLKLIASTKINKRLISALYQSESWNPWILERLGLSDTTLPTKYVDVIQKKANLENVCYGIYVSSLNQMMQENDIEEIYKSLSQLEYSPFISERDIQYSRAATDVADRVMQLRTVVSYDNADDISSAIEKKISGIQEQISAFPTEIACCKISPLLLKISDICHKHMERLVDSKVPIVTISPICDASIVEGNLCRVQIQVCNMEGRMKILAGSLYIQSINGFIVDPKLYTKLLNDTLQGGGKQYFQFDIPVSTEDIARGELNPLSVCFSYETNELTKETKSEDLHIRISHPEQFITIPNPYSEFAHANTVEDDAMFKGRETTIQEICDNVVKSKKCYAIYGQKRSGKSSVLFHIAKKLTSENKALAVHFSIGQNILGDRDNDNTVLNNLYYLFLKEIENALKRKDKSVYREVFGRGVKWDDIKDNPEVQFRDRLDLIIDTLQERYSFETNKIVLLIDEYTYLYSFIKQKLITPQFMIKMKALIENNYFTVVVAGHDAMPNFYDEFKNELRIFDPYKLDYIDEKSARELIEDPIRNSDGTSRYQKEAVDRIIKLTACSPFYIQIICDEIVRYANLNRHSQITIIDVASVLTKLVTNQGSISFGDFDNLISSGDGKLNPEEVQKTYRVLQEIAVRTRKIEYCRQKDISVFSPSEDNRIISDLIKRDVVVEDKQYVGEKRIKIKVELFKEWINNNED